MTATALNVPSLKGKVPPEEWAARVDLAAAYRLVSLYKWDADYFRSAKIAAYSGRSPVGREPAKRQYAQWVYGWQDRSDTGIYEGSR